MGTYKKLFERLKNVWSEKKIILSTLEGEIIESNERMQTFCISRYEDGKL